ncbi:hypothetical protein DRO54_02500 [Candidatus Bathyarchaeota archaeon]|nr:MAG: hypothetical protein DRO54_02500 [Candidatus Bathyarchaeota archaeon]
MATFWAFNHAAMDEGRTTRASESSAIGYIKDKAAFRASQDMLPFRSQRCHPSFKACKMPIKTFLTYPLKNSYLRMNDRNVFLKMWE